MDEKVPHISPSPIYNRWFIHNEFSNYRVSLEYRPESTQDIPHLKDCYIIGPNNLHCVIILWVQFFVK